MLGVAVALAFGVAHAAPATLSYGSIKAVINDGGSFLVSPGTALGRPGLSYNGVEFVNIDNPSSWWTARGDGFNLTSQYNSNPLGTTTYGLGSSAATTLKIGRLSFVQTVALTASNQISYLVSVTSNPRPAKSMA